AGLPVPSKIRPPRMTSVPSGPCGSGLTGTRRGSSETGVLGSSVFFRSSARPWAAARGTRQTATIAATGAKHDKARALMRPLLLGFRGSGLRDGRLDVRRVALRTVDPVGGGLEVGVPGLEDVRHVLLRVAVDDGEPGALHLGHDAVALQEAV